MKADDSKDASIRHHMEAALYWFEIISKESAKQDRRINHLHKHLQMLQVELNPDATDAEKLSVMLGLR